MSTNRSLLRLVSSAAMVVAPLAIAQAQFEGTITMRLAAATGGGDMQYSIKGDKLRIDIAARGAGMYIVTQNSKAVMVMPAQRMYFEPKIPVQPGQAQAAAAKKPT